MKKQLKLKKALALFVSLIMMLSLMTAGIPVMAETTEASGAIVLPDLISDNALFQRGKPINIWGTATANGKVSVQLLDGESVLSQAEAAADESGSFSTELSAVAAGGPYELKVTCGEEVKIVSNILIGELWFLSGQSNMEAKIQYTGSYKTDMLNIVDENDDIRLFIRSYKWNNQTAEEPQSDLDGKWVTVTKDNVSEFSAVGWSAIKELYDNLGGCPVGGIESSASGASMASLRKNAAAPNAFNRIIAPVTKMNIRGMFWYQGEADRNNTNFTESFTKLANEYRAEWSNPNMPVIYVQLAGSPILISDCNSKQNYAEARYAQLRALYNIDGTVGMVNAADRKLPVSTDESTVVHYPDKQVVGQRLGQTAANLVYGIDGEFLAPTYTGFKAENGKITVNFANTYKGLTTSDGKNVRGFTVAGKDGVYKPAVAEISEDKTSVILSNTEITEPKSFRYCDDTTLAGVVIDGESYVNPNLVNSADIAALACESDIDNVKEIKPQYTLPVQDFNFKIGSNASLPTIVTLNCADGSATEKAVAWNKAVDTASEKHFTVFGAVEGTAVLAIANVNVTEDTSFSVAQTSPENEELDVDLGKTVKIKFNKPIDTATLTDDNIAIKVNGKLVDKTISYDPVNRTAELKFSKLAGMKYTVSVSGSVKDTDGAALGDDYSFIFTTDSIYYFENFENIADPALSTGAGVGGDYYRISDTASISKGGNDCVINEQQLKIAFKSGKGIVMYKMNDGIEIKDRIVVSYDLTRHDTNAHIGMRLLLNDKTNSVIESSPINWRGANYYNYIDGTNTSYVKGTHHFEAVLDPFSKKAYTYMDGIALQEHDLSNVTDWNLTRINFNSWGFSKGTSESIVDIDNIAVYKLNAELSDEGIESSITDRQEGVAVNEPIVLSFGKEISSAALDGKITLTTGGSDVNYTGSYNIFTNTYTITPETETDNVYTLTINDLTAIDDTVLAGKTVRFKTALHKLDFENVGELSFTNNEAALTGTGVRIHKGNSDVQVVDDGENKYLNMDMGNKCLVQYIINSIISGTENNKVAVEYDLYIADMVQNFNQKVLFGGKTHINNDKYSLEFAITPNGTIGINGNEKYQSASGVVKTGWNKIKLIFDFDKLSASIYVGDNKVVDDFSILDITPSVDKKQCVGIGKLAFHTWSGTEEKHNYKLDNIVVKTVNEAEVKTSLKNGEDTIVDLANVTDTSSLKASFDIRNNSFDNGSDLMVAMAVYGSDGSLKNTEVKTLTGVAGSYSYSCDDFGLAESAALESGDTIKLFVWKNGTNSPVSMPNIIIK